MKKVGIIGGAGFIGSHITKRFLNNGFQVKVSTTDITKKEKYEHLKKLYYNENLSISELKLEHKDQLQDFVKDCDVVIHSGTPFQLDFKDATTELLEPTIKGTENFLEVVNMSHSVKKVVIIASVAAYNTHFPLPPSNKTPDDTICETDAPFMSEESHPYAQAKFMANAVVNNFIQNNPNATFEITSISPVGVFGKALSQRQDSTSTGLQYLIKNNLAPNPFMQMLYDTNAEMAIVNVTDVARAVYKAATSTGLHGKNYLLSSESYAMSDIHFMLNNKAPQNQAKIIYQNQLAKQELDMNFLSVKDTLIHYNL